MSDRILVLHEGRIAAEIPRDEATEERRDVRRDRAGRRPGEAGRPPMAETAPPRRRSRRAGAAVARSCATVARQRELSLVVVMLVLGALVATRGAAVPVRLATYARSRSLASIIAIAAIGAGLVVITRNIDLSVEAVMGLVAFCVADTSRRDVLNGPGRDAVGRRARPRARDGQRRARHGAPGARRSSRRWAR